MNTRGSGTASLHRTALRQRLHHCWRLRFIYCLSQNGDFFALLHGEGQPALEFGIQRVFTTQINRAVQQGTGRRDPQTWTQTLIGVLQHSQRFFKVTPPDVTPVDHSQRQHFIGGQTIEDGRVLVGGTHQINVQTVDRQVSRQTQVFFQTTEISGE
ncbi:hypothetical protein D3C77_508480 [compost metagenome]